MCDILFFIIKMKSGDAKRKAMLPWKKTREPDCVDVAHAKKGNVVARSAPTLASRWVFLRPFNWAHFATLTSISASTWRRSSFFPSYCVYAVTHVLQ